MNERSTGVGSSFAANFRAVLAAVVGNPRSDGELLRQYVAERNDEAFAELVRRLGPSVWSVCRRFLDAADAEDAFQTTFLVLARKASTVQPPGKVAAWILGVAHLAARKARTTRHRRMARVSILAELPETAAREVSCEPDVGPVLHEELNRLPEKFRLPIVLCELRELTTSQAANELGWPVGTVASRLSRGRSLLSDRLLRRGITSAAVTATLGSLARTATATVPKALLAETLTLTATTGAAKTAAVMTLTSEVLRAMTMTKLSLIGAGLVASAALALYGGIASQSQMIAAPAPVPEKTAAADPLDRFKLEGLILLLKPEEIQKDIALTAEQTKALEEARKEAKEKIEEEMQKMFQGKMAAAPAIPLPAGGGRVFASSTAVGASSITATPLAAFDKAALALLKPEQTRRLRQLVVQIQGPKALLDRRVIRLLELTAEQEDGIDAELAQMPKYAGDAEKYATETDKTMAAAMKLLTDAQRAKWEKFIGKPLPSAELAKANPQFNDPTGGAMPAIGGKAGGIIIQGAAPLQPAVPPPPRP